MRFLSFGIVLLLGLLPAADAAAQAKLQQGGKGIFLEVVIVEVPASPGTIAETTTMTQEKILELEKQGKVSRWSRVQFTTLESQTAVMQFGERGPSSGSKPAGLFQLAANQVSGQDSGTIVQVTPRIEEKGSILMFLDVQQQTLVDPPVPVGAEKSEPGKKDAAPPAAGTTAIVRCSTTLRLEPGIWNVSGVQRSDKSPTQTWILVNAKVLETK